MTIHYHKYENETLTNKKLKGTARDLYDFMLAQSHLHGRDFCMSIAELAEGILRSPETTRMHLNYLVRMGFVTRILRRDFARRKWNLKSRFIVHDIAQNVIPQEQPILLEYITQGRYYEKITVPPQENLEGNDSRENLERNQNLTLTGGVSELSENSDNSESLSVVLTTPSCETQPALLEKPKPSNQAEAVKAVYDLTGVPEIMHHAVKYLLTETGRTAITPHECKVIREILEKQHTPERVMKEIDTCVERFKRKGKNLRQLTFSYIGAVLENQTSRKYRKNTRTRNTDTPQNTSLAVQEQENMPDVSAPVMPVEEAEKVIAEYVPAVKPEEPLPVAFQEFLGRIKAREQELNDEYIATLPVNENGLTVFTEENSAELLRCRITPEDYLRLKFPEATEEELRSDYNGTHNSYSDFDVRDKRDIEQAMKIDYACATCTSPDNCQLPTWCKKGSSRLSVALKKDIRGRRFVQVVGGAVIRCKHGCKEQNSPEFESRMKRSGLSDQQRKQTFTAYEHVGQPPEIVSAKAMSILAAKGQKSIVLAGKPGTGKTHLAVAIALEAMRARRQALFRSVPEMLDELRQTLREHGDFYGVMRRLKDVPCLVLDDLGKEKTTQAGLDYLFQIIDYRYRNGKQTVITTNALTMAELKNPYNADKIEPIISRILESGDWITIQSTENYRLRKQAESMSVKAEIAPKPGPETPTYEPKELVAPVDNQTEPELDSLPEDDYSTEQERQMQVAEEAMKEVYDEISADMGTESRKPKTDSDDWDDDGYERELAEREREMLEKLCPARVRYTPEERDREIQERLRQAQEILRMYELAHVMPAAIDDGLDDGEDEYRLYGDTGIFER